MARRRATGRRRWRGSCDRLPYHGSVEIRFHAELNDHLPPVSRQQALERRALVARSVKDVIESCGVPHTEVGRIVVNGAPAGFGHLVHDDDRVEVWPGLIAGDPRFVLDVHLGKLAARLRMLGFDTVYRSCFHDAELVEVSVDEARVLLTRDRGLLKHGALTRGYWLRETDSRRQLAEIVGRFRLESEMRPFTRCMACNAPLDDAAKESVVAAVPPRVAAAFNEFRRCPRCRRVYWRGSHYRRMVESIAEWR
jgi:uncharacterized protein with PIN domain